MHTHSEGVSVLVHVGGTLKTKETYIQNKRNVQKQKANAHTLCDCISDSVLVHAEGKDLHTK